MSSADDQRQYITFYGIKYEDWYETFGTFVNWQHLLVREYISDGCSCATSSSLDEDGLIYKFLYPHHIKKTYFIEGRIEGNFVVTCQGDDATLNAYRVTVCKMHDDNTDTELASTGWVTVDKLLLWDDELGIGDESVFHFWIDCWSEKELSEFERIYVKIEFQTEDEGILFLHCNDATWEDFYVEIPFKM
jgi:hypothetical protein